MKWYSVKLLYRFSVTGEPDNVDMYYSDDREIFEETVMLVKAETFEGAYAEAERIAAEHKDVFKNRYDQTVEYKFAESLDCYCIGETLESGAEIYSSIKGAPKGTTTDLYIDNELERIFDLSSSHILRSEE